MRKGISKYTPEICEWLKNNHKGKTSIDLAKEMSELFGLDITADKLQNLKTRIRVRDGFRFEPAINNGCYKKGQEPFNKGLKWDDYLTKEQQVKSLQTTYKKGHKSSNAVNVGDEAMRCNSHDEGYVYVKVCDGKRNKNWKPKQQLIWEQEYGEIPKGHKVIFLDGDRFNFDINNLALVTNGEELHINKLDLVSGNPELKKTAVLAVKTRFKTLEKERNMKNEQKN
jgi:hypothetical protein